MGSPAASQREPKFKLHQPVQRINQPEAIGIVLEIHPDRQLSTWKYAVIFGTERRIVPEEALQALEIKQTVWDALTDGVFSGKEHFICTLTYHRLLHPPTRIAHSFASARTQFYPHQFKPLLKFLDNPKKRILIADDVGLGKTIEAGYILRELDARQGRLDRVLVVCPARLSPKWKKEMRDRFNRHDSPHGVLQRADRLAHLYAIASPAGSGESGHPVSQ
jgi:hypothetical protein